MVTMDFKQNHSKKRFSEDTGYILGYLLFTIGVYLLLVLLNRIPNTGISFIKVSISTFILTLLGIFIKKLLK
jgi:hypothetical protein